MALNPVAYDPKTTATQLATQSVDLQQKGINADVKASNALKSGIAELRSALSAFQAALGGYTSSQSAIVTTAVLTPELGTASASSTASDGNYTVFVEQIAKAHQMSYSGLTDNPAAGAGLMKVQLAGGSSFNVDLSAADADANGLLSVKEIANAINHASGNSGRIIASVATFNGLSNLILTSANTGAANSATLDTSAMGDSALKSQLNNPAGQKVFVAGKDAIIWLGDQGAGTKIQQASNTFSIIDGVKMTFTKAQAAGSEPASLVIGADSAATAAKVNGFIDAWNKLAGTLKDLMSHGDSTKKIAPSIFASDAGLIALKNRMDSLLRTSSGGKSLVNFGVTAQRDGTLTLDSQRFKRTFETDAASLDKILGGVDGGGSGVMGGLNKALSDWTGMKGQLGARENSETAHEKKLEKRQEKLDDQYASAYKHYLAQFTRLQALQTQMSSNSSLFDALFSNENK